MKRNQRILAVMLVIITLLTLLPVSALAYKIETIKYGEWYKLDRGDTYRLRLTSETAIIATWKNRNPDGRGLIYPDKDCEEDPIFYLFDYGSANNGSNGVVLNRGTYYIWLHDWNKKASVKFTKAPSNINKPNYCISKAITMKKNKKYPLSQTMKNNYRRWYKIKLTNSQVITISGYVNSSGYYCLYDSNLNEINCKYNDTTGNITTRGKQSKGTYYFTISEEDLNYIRDKGYYYNLSWK